MQRAHRELLDQHAPALAGHLRTTDDAIDRHEHVPGTQRSVLEGDVEGKVARADFHRRAVWRSIRGAGDAEVGLGPPSSRSGSKHAEGQADHRGDRERV